MHIVNSGATLPELEVHQKRWDRICRVSCGMRIVSQIILYFVRHVRSMVQKLHCSNSSTKLDITAPIPMIMERFAGTKTLYIVKCTYEGCRLEYPRNVISQDDLGGA
jgi:hypothetical protein